MSAVSDAVSHALPVPVEDGSTSEVDLRELQSELDRVAEEALSAREQDGGRLPLSKAVNDPRFPALRRFHQDLRDAMFLEIPRELQPWVEGLGRGVEATENLGQTLTSLARPEPQRSESSPEHAQLQQALAELLVFEAVRLRLLVAAWHSEEFERLGGEESDIDEIAWEEVSSLLDEPAVTDPSVRPLQVMTAAASISLARDAADRAGALRQAGGDLREELSMRARLRAALRELRLTESVLLENALSGLLGEERVELHELQADRPIALEGLSRQAMDQRVSRGRRAMTRSRQDWPRRRRPALFDLLRDK